MPPSESSAVVRAIA